MRKLAISLVALAFILGFGVTSATAEEHQVEKGDNLWDIAQEYDVDVLELMHINELDNTVIHPEQLLTIDKDELEGETSDDSDEKSDDDQENDDEKDTDEDSDEDEDNDSEDEEKDTDDDSDEDDKASEDEDKESDDEDDSDEPEGETLTLESTAYTASCTGCSGVTAAGTDLNANPDEKVVAVDPDVIPLGSEVYVEGYGYATADDTGGDIQGDRIDLFMASEDDANDYGRQSIDVTIVD